MQDPTASAFGDKHDYPMHISASAIDRLSHTQNWVHPAKPVLKYTESNQDTPQFPKSEYDYTGMEFFCFELVGNRHQAKVQLLQRRRSGIHSFCRVKRVIRIQRRRGRITWGSGTLNAHLHYAQRSALQRARSAWGICQCNWVRIVPT